MPRHATRNPPRYFVETDHSYDRPYAVVDSRTGDVIDRRYATRQKAVDLAAAENEAAARPRRSESFAYAYMPNGSAQRGILALPDDRNRRAILAAVRAVGSLHESHVAVKELGRGRFVATVSVSAVAPGDRVVTWRDNGEGRTDMEAINDAMASIVADLPRVAHANGCGCEKRPSVSNPSSAVPLVLRNNATTQSILRKIKAFGEFYGATVKPLRGGGVRVTLVVENDRNGEFERWSDVGRGRTTSEAIDDALDGILAQL